MNKNNISDEIDIKQLLLKLYKFVVRYKFILIITFIISILVGIFKYSKTDIYYEAQMQISSGLLYEKGKDLYEVDLQPIMSILSALQSQAENQNFDYVEHYLNIEDASFIKKIDASVYVDKNLSRVEPKNIVITVEVRDKEKLFVLQQKILEYCNNNDFIKSSFKNQVNYFIRSEKLLNEKISAFGTIDFKNGNSGQIYFMNFNELSKMIDFEINRIKIQDFYNTNEPVILVQEFSDFPKEINKKTEKAAIYFVLTLILGFFVALFIEFVKFFKNE